MVELLALCVLFTLLSFLALPMFVRAKQGANQTTCQSNLRQIGLALQSYAVDNSDTLPGPVFELATAQYDQRSTNQLAWFVAERIGSPRPSARPTVAPLLLCPAQAPGGSDRAGSAASYVLNPGGRGMGKALPGAPFGQPNAPVAAPLRLSCVATSTPPSVCWAMADADKGNVNPTLKGWKDLPYQPVHGKVRNQLYFDWHVDARRW